MRPGKVEARRHAHVPIAKKGPETHTSWGAHPLKTTKTSLHAWLPSMECSKSGLWRMGEMCVGTRFRHGEQSSIHRFRIASGGGHAAEIIREIVAKERLYS